MVAFNSWHHCSKEHHKGWLDKSALCISVKSYVQNYTDIKSFGLLNHKKKHSQADDVCENMWRQSDLVPVNICYSYKWSVLFTHNSWIVALAKNGVTIKGLLHSCMWTGDVEHSWAALQPASAVSFCSQQLINVYSWAISRKKVQWYHVSPVQMVLSPEMSVLGIWQKETKPAWRTKEATLCCNNKNK